ncbi:hypothetical protein C8K36_103402 [Rhodococcus sp. OK519]|nr:hypothetical protein C8K36_103402 [Rhodococcus sp. OK519]
MGSGDFVGQFFGILGGGLQLLGSTELGQGVQMVGIYLAQAVGSLGS